ncbi:MAG: phytoene desaturase [Jatrophihabitantaceae bacterium]|nr:phytoene desaturase [Jatrophihabitantaceae bacterium]
MSAIIVIGAGMSGLAVASRLAALGHTVTVCEAGPVTGGKAGEAVRTTVTGRFVFDTGPSLLTYPAVFHELFADTGTPLDESVRLRRLDPIARYRFADGTVLDSRADPAVMQDHIRARLGAEAAGDWAAFQRRAALMWRAVEGPFLRGELRPTDLLRAAPRWPLLPAIAPGRSLRHVAHRYMRDPRLRMMADRFASYAGSAPSRIPAAYAVIAHLESAMGGWYVEGGLRRLIDAVEARAVRLGANLRLDTPVSAIISDGNDVTGVELADGTRLAADVVVATIDVGVTYQQLAAGLGHGARRVRLAARRRRLGAAPRSLAGFSMLLGVRGATPGVAHHNVLFPAEYGDEYDSIFGDPARLPADPAIYVSIPDDPDVRPDGFEAWSVLVNVPRHDAHGARDAVDWTDPELRSAYSDRILGLLAARGMAVRDRLEFAIIRTPADLEAETGTPGGAIYGTAAHGAIRSLRPANRSPLRGLFLAGGTVHPGGGLPLAALSARTVARAIGPARR